MKDNQIRIMPDTCIKPLYNYKAKDDNEYSQSKNIQIDNVDEIER